MSRRLSEQFDAVNVSFGEYVRILARGLGEDLSRERLQALGNQLILENNIDSFVTNVLSFYLQSGEKREAVIEGVRHRSIWNAISNLTAKSALIYIDIEDEVRLKRVINRDGLTADDVELSFNNEMEINAKCLREDASLILKNDDVEGWVESVVKFMQTIIL